MNFSVVVRFLRDAVGIFCARQWASRRTGLAAATYVIDCREGTIGSPHFSARVPEALKCLLCAVSFWGTCEGICDFLTGDVTSWTRCRSRCCERGFRKELRRQAYQYRARHCRLSRRRYGLRRPCRTGSVAVALQMASWWLCTTGVDQEVAGQAGVLGRRGERIGSSVSGGEASYMRSWCTETSSRRRTKALPRADFGELRLAQSSGSQFAAFAPRSTARREAIVR
jgi:hypothetical protein